VFIPTVSASALPYLSGFRTNETHTLQFIRTNTLFVSGGGDAGVNGNYVLQGTVGGITVWTNAAGTFGIAFDPNINVFLNEQNITNGAGSLRYSAVGTSPFPQTGTWAAGGSGTGPNPTVVVGTNLVTAVVIAEYPVTGVAASGVSFGTNFYYVNPVTGNDTNANPRQKGPAISVFYQRHYGVRGGIQMTWCIWKLAQTISGSLILSFPTGSASLLGSAGAVLVI